MKRAIYYNPQRALLSKRDSDVIYSINENQQLSTLNVPFSLEILSTPSFNMRMCCCSMSC